MRYLKKLAFLKKKLIFYCVIGRSNILMTFKIFKPDDFGYITGVILIHIETT